MGKLEEVDMARGYREGDGYYLDHNGTLSGPCEKEGQGFCSGRATEGPGGVLCGAHLLDHIKVR